MSSTRSSTPDSSSGDSYSSWESLSSSSSYSIYREPNTSKNQQKVALRLKESDHDIYLTRISTPSNEAAKELINKAKGKEGRFVVISSKELDPQSKKLESWYVIPQEDYNDNQKEIREIIQKIEFPSVAEGGEKTAQLKLSDVKEKKGPSGVWNLKITVNKGGITHSYGVIKMRYDVADQGRSDAADKLSKDPAVRVLRTLSSDKGDVKTLYFIPAAYTQEEEEEIRKRVDDPGLILSYDEGESGQVLVNLSGRKFVGSGGEGEVYAEQVMTVKSAPSAAAVVQESVVASKEGQVKGKVEGLESVWQEIENVIGEEGAKQVGGIQPPYMKELSKSSVAGRPPTITGEYFVEDLEGVVKDAATTKEDKTKYALSLLQGFFWLMRVGSLHGDFKLQNFMVRGEGKGAVIIDHPDQPLYTSVDSPEKAKEALFQLPFVTITAELSNMNQLEKIMNDVKSTAQLYAKGQISDADLITTTNELLKRFRQEQTFIMGMALYELFVGFNERPYPMKQMAYGSNKMTTDVGLAQLVQPQEVLNKLMNAGCSQDLAALICRMVNINPALRPMHTTIAPFIQSFSPEVADLIQEAVVTENRDSVKDLWKELIKVTGEGNAKLIRGLQHQSMKERDVKLASGVPLGVKGRTDETNKHAIDLIQGLFWLQLIGSLHAELNVDNFVTKGKEGDVAIINHPQQKACRLVDSPEMAKVALNQLKQFPINSKCCDVLLCQEIQKNARMASLEASLNQISNTDLIRKTNKLIINFRQAQSFAMGLSLYQLYVGSDKSPFPNGVGSASEAELENMEVELVRAGCPQDLIDLITDMMHPLSRFRPTVFDFLPIIKKYNPEVVKLLDEVYYSQWDQQPTLVDRIFSTTVGKINDALQWFFRNE